MITSRRDRPRQAVIVAGGRGTRLGHLTEQRPKALVEVAGRPFLDWLVESVRDRGFERVLLLLGYRAEDVIHHVGDGHRWGVEAESVVTPPDDETGRRFLAAMPRLDERFLFLYCDNLWPMPFDDLWERYVALDVSAMITVYRNDDGFTRSNVRVDAGGRVAAYDPSRSDPSLAGVEIGYGIFERSVLDHLDGANLSLQDAVYPELIRRGELGAFLTSHRYYSIGKPERLPITESYLRGAPAVILDRDGVLNRKPPRAQYVRNWDEWEWLPGAREAIALLTQAGRRVFIVSNQAGIGRGAMTEGDLERIHRQMVAEVEAAGGRIDAIYHCPHDWDEGCECRKPRPGMLFRAQREHHVDLSTTVFIGDDERDAQAAKAAGSPSALVSPERGLLDIVREHLNIDTEEGAA